MLMLRQVPIETLFREFLVGGSEARYISLSVLFSEVPAPTSTVIGDWTISGQ